LSCARPQLLYFAVVDVVFVVAVEVTEGVIVPRALGSRMYLTRRLDDIKTC